MTISSFPGTQPITPPAVRIAPGTPEVVRPGSYIDDFEAVAARWPDRCAVQAGERRVGYGELDRLADTCAAELARAGCGKETIVAVCLERSPEMVAALLGVMKCGAAFLPLDPEFPEERLRSLVERSGTRAVVTHPDQAAAFAGCGARVVPFPASEESALPAPARARRTHPSGLAYVIYTSGSTGAPKGVAVTHGSFYRYIRWALDYYGFDPDGVSVVHTSCAFDLTLTSIFCPLLLGMRLVVIPEDEGVQGLLRLLDEGAEPVSLLKMTPSHVRLLVDAAGAGGRPWRCGVLILGGEKLLPQHVRFWESRDPATRIYNEYGPTEATVGCCVARVTSSDPTVNGALPIGTAVAGAALHIGDPAAGDGESAEGELFIGGPCLARGYLDAPALTAERFVPDPHTPGGRLYRTGDQVRALDGGGLAYLGRNDRQRKINGVRIELGEIEAVLRRSPGIEQAAVVPLPGGGDQETLAAFVSVADPADGRVDLAALTGALAAQIHHAAVPAEFYLVQRLPVALSGKLDYDRLIGERHTYPRVRDRFLPPRNPTEDLMASLWCAVLDIDEVGIDDSFFALDGNSMKSIQFIYEARKHGLHLTTRDIFEHQTIRRLSEVVRARGPGAPAAPAPPAPLSLLDPRDRERLPEGVEDAYPLAMLQAGTLLESDQRAGSGTYHNVNSYHVECPLDVELFRESLALLRGRHPILRTAYDYVSYTRPLQLVWRGVEIPLEVVDIRDLAADAQQAYVDDFIARESLNAFDWTRPPLLRFFIHIRGEGRFQLTLSKHHSILDGWSAATLISEIVHNYFALRAGEAPPYRLPVETTYREFVALEQEAIRSPAFRDFWRGRVGDAASHLPGPWGGGKPARDYAHSSIVTRTVPVSEELSTRLRALARRAHVPLKSLLLAVHMRILAQVTGSSSLVTGVVSHGRPETTDADKAIGLFINTVPFPFVLEERFSWLDAARRIFDEERRMYPYQRYPMAQAKKDLGREKLFDSIFYYTNFHVFRGFRTSDEVRFIDSAGFEETEIPLTVAFSLHPLWSTISLAIHFHVDHFSAAQVDHVVEYARQALQAIDAEPDARALGRPLTTDAERLAVQPRRAATEPAGTVFGLFREQARARPDAVALATADGRVTYGALLRRSESLAAELAARGVGADRIVGICVDRPAEAVAAMLAVLAASGCYAIVDGGLPAARLDEVLDQLRPTLVLADEANAGRFADRPFEVVRMPDGAAPARPAAPLPPSAGGEEMAYVVFTSGSTGRPKGVMVSHAALYRSTRTRLRFYPERYERFLLLSRLTFDSAFAGIWGTLCGGGTLHLLDADDATDAGQVAGRIREWEVSHFLAIPSLYRVLLPELAPGEDSTLRTAIVAGEELTADLVRAHRERLPAVPLVNEYGPTEGTVWASAIDVAAEAGVTIGGALEHVSAAVCDEGMRPVSLGAPGELFIGGDALARGYLGDPRTTAQRFVPDPWGTGEGDARLYRTGDVVRAHPDGRLQYEGRADNQIKVRGFRIEPEEIERAFHEAFPGREAMVGVREEAPGQKRICLYHARGDGADAEPLTTGAVRAALSARLPRHTLPDEAWEVDALPRLPNGKLDRGRAPQVDARRAAAEPAPRAPANEVERALAGLWSEALSLPQVGVDRSFLEIGGDSLLANQVVLRMQRIFGARLLLKEFYQEPTIAAHARLLRERGEGEGVDVERIASIWNQME